MAYDIIGLEIRGKSVHWEPKMLNIAICDDTKSDTETAAALVNAYSAEHKELDLTYSVFSDADELLFSMDDARYDLLLLDILMPKTTGIELGEKIKAIDKDATLVYMTTSRDYAVDAFSIYAFQYLIKPLERVSFFRMMDSYVRFRQVSAGRSISIKTADGVRNIFFNEISYAECQGHIVIAHLKNGDIVESTHIRIPFPEYVATLLDDERFVITHKSFVVNMDHVARISQQQFTMAGGTIVPISRKNYAEVKRAYLKHISSHVSME